jgi:hypothetical protein
MSAITAKLRRIVGGHEQAAGRVLDVWNGTPIAESNRPVMVRGNDCMPPEVTRSRYVEPPNLDPLRRARS